MGAAGLVAPQMAAGRGPGQTPVHVDDPRYESWEVVRDFADVRTARAWHQALTEAGIEAALTADWPLDRFGHGDIQLCVPGDRGARPRCISATLMSPTTEGASHRSSGATVSSGSSPYESRLTV